MSVLTKATGHARPKAAAVAQHFSALEPAIYDADESKRTYQLVERDGDQVPFILSAAGAHADTLLDTLNQSKLIAWKRDQLPADDSDADAEREQFKAQLKQLLTVALERCDRAARAFILYADAELGAEVDAEVAAA